MNINLFKFLRINGPWHDMGLQILMGLKCLELDPFGNCIYTFNKKATQPS